MADVHSPAVWRREETNGGRYHLVTRQTNPCNSQKSGPWEVAGTAVSQKEQVWMVRPLCKGFLINFLANIQKNGDFHTYDSLYFSLICPPSPLRFLPFAVLSAHPSSQ